jgi:DNA (cytosine-5)-methyltransferase 1
VSRVVRDVRPSQAVTIGSLFSGIGGLEFGLERAGLGPVLWQVEIDPYCRAVLARHWPTVQRFSDVRAFEGTPVDVICGGFPCQDVSGAGKGAGIDGARSGLWREFSRIVGKLSPRWVVVENVASGKTRWLCQVRTDLHALGYSTTAYALSAADVGAPHLRRRIFVLGHSSSIGLEDDQQTGSEARTAGGSAVANRDGDGQQQQQQAARLHADGPQRDDPSRCHRFPPRRGDAAGWAAYAGPQPGIRRSVDGISAGVDGATVNTAGDADRLRALGNAVVPQCAEVIGRIIAESMRTLAESCCGT